VCLVFLCLAMFDLYILLATVRVLCHLIYDVTCVCCEQYITYLLTYYLYSIFVLKDLNLNDLLAIFFITVPYCT